MDILKWIQCNFPYYPHCSGLKDPSTLKTGVAIAEILTDLLPQHYHHLFLPYIEIHNLSLQNCINNLKTILQTLQKCTKNHQVRQHTPEGLYYRDGELMAFMRDIIMNLQIKTQTTTYTQMVASHEQKKVSNIEELSEIANLSSLTMKEQPKTAEMMIYEHKEEEQDIGLEKQALMRLQKWIEGLGLSDLEDSPQYLFGCIVNAVFADGRMSQPIIKEAHFDQGANAIYRKSLNFLLKNQKADKLDKINALQMLKQIQEESLIKQSTYWLTLYDIYNFAFKRVKYSRLDSKSKPPQQENICINRKPTSVATLRTVKQTNNYSVQTVRQTEKWISNELGYEHSLKKSKTTNNELENPLFNGNLLGSIVMRLKIGRPTIIKQPTSKKHIKMNLQEIGRVCSHRNYKSIRKIFMIESSYEEYIGILSELRQEHKVNNPQTSHKRSQTSRKCNQCHQHSTILNNHESKEEIKSWTLKKTNIEIDKLTASKLSEVCSELLNINLYRQTTNRIQQSNIDKILGELRRIGLTTFYLTDREEVQKNEQLRWKILSHIMSLIEGNVFY